MWWRNACMAISLITAIALYFGYYITVISKRPKLPPGPMGVPLLGNLVQMVKDPHLKLSQWALRYGKMYTIHMANRATLVVNDAKWLKELLGTMASTGKFKTDVLFFISQGPYGVLNTVGTAWEEQRQFCIKSLKQLGYGKGRLMEPLILNEVHELSEWIRQSGKDNLGVVNLNRVLSQATVNALWTLVTGERFKFDDTKSIHLWNVFMDAIQYSMKTGLGFFPWLKYVAPKLSGYTELDKSCKDIHASIGDKFEKHMKSFVEGDARDLIDMYIEHMRKVNENGTGEQSSFFGEYGRKNCVSSVVEIFCAGGESMSGTLKWAIVYISHDEKVQRKLQNEIDAVVGRDGDPTLHDKTRMPYTEAVILETLRLSSIAYLGGPHELHEDVAFQGYTLPKGLVLMTNIYHIHHDPEIWPDPNDFRPERFLSVAEQRLKDYLVPFQAGKRQCLGAPFARDVLFLFLVKLCQQFDFKPDSSVSKEEYFQADVGFLLIPKC